MSDWTYIKLADSFKLPLKNAFSLICKGRLCDECPLFDFNCSRLTNPPIDNDDEIWKLDKIAILEDWIRTHYCANAGTEYAETDQFICSECGLHLQDWVQIVDSDDTEDTTLSEYTFKYCPNCGREILPRTTLD